MQIQFMKYRKIAITLSVICILGSIFSLATRGLNYGLDFTGGTLLELEYPQEANAEQIRLLLDEAGVEGAVVQYLGSSAEIAIRVPPQPESAQQVATENAIGAAGKEIFAAIQAADPAGDQIKLQRNEFVGPSFGEELRDDGGIALIVALGFMMVYIGIRFHYRFGIGAVAALLHDIIIVLGLFSIFQLTADQTVLAAILAVIGYSLNDTIVVADRVRENFKDNLDSKDTAGLIDLSLNQTLSRTLFTSLTTLLVLISLYIFGGPTLQVFSFALLAGIVIGTYSSIYVASSLLISLGVLPEQFKEQELVELEDELP